MKKLILLFASFSLLFVACTKEGDLDIVAIEEKLNGQQDLGNDTPNYCTSSYEGPSANIDIQLNVFCQAAYAYLCIDGYSASSQQVQGNCATYNQLNEGSTPCPYCQ